MNYYIDSFFKNYANFSGRAPRKYFWIVLISTVIIIILSALPYYFLQQVEFLNIISLLFAVIIGIINFVPLFSLLVRRIHDVDYSFWYYLIPIFNLYLLILVLFSRGTDGPNNFGDEYPDLE